VLLGDAFCRHCEYFWNCCAVGLLPPPPDPPLPPEPPEPLEPEPPEPESPEPDPLEPEPLEPEPDVPDPLVPEVPEPEPEPSEPEPGPLEPEPEPESPADVAEALDLPTEEPTRGEVAQLREEQREAEATPDSPGAQIRVDEPWNGYRSMAAADIVDRLAVADDATKAQVRLYESTHRRRKTVLEATEQ
jgi:hypothetical protein